MKKLFKIILGVFLVGCVAVSCERVMSFDGREVDGYVVAYPENLLSRGVVVSDSPRAYEFSYGGNGSIQVLLCDCHHLVERENAQSREYVSREHYIEAALNGSFRSDVKDRRYVAFYRFVFVDDYNGSVMYFNMEEK